MNLRRLLLNKKMVVVVGMVVVVMVGVKVRRDVEKKREIIQLAQRLLAELEERRWATQLGPSTGIAVVTDVSFTFSDADVTYVAPDKRIVHGLGVMNIARTMKRKGVESPPLSMDLDRHLELKLQQKHGTWVVTNMEDKWYDQRGWHERLRDRIKDNLSSFLP